MSRRAEALFFLAPILAVALATGCVTTKIEDGKYDAAFQDKLRDLGSRYETLDASRVSTLYASDTFAHAFAIPRSWETYDTSGPEHEASVERRLARLSAVKFELTDKVLTWNRGRHRVFTLQGIRVTETLKDGRVSEFEGRHSAMWEKKKDGDWVIEHEHFGGVRSASITATPPTVPAPIAIAAPPPVSTPAPPPAAPSAPAVAAALTDVFFDFDRSEIRPDQRPAIDADVAYLKERPGVAVTIEGHCDARGTRSYNMALGWRRAESAKEALVAQGVEESRLKTISYGKERPFVHGSGEAVWSQNRRAHFVEGKK
ncbi:MAG TPA: peptidoglycan-associated lipoprotein Pal [Thermoanaerobaculia bacterium]|nr:peptidoglycan-associated lipoprotein Pal [Thermoanaerobaculia bacterium]